MKAYIILSLHQFSRHKHRAGDAVPAVVRRAGVEVQRTGAQGNTVGAIAPAAGYHLTRTIMPPALTVEATLTNGCYRCSYAVELDCSLGAI